MKQKFLLYILILNLNFTYAQETWFTLFTDSTSLVKNANKLSMAFVSDVKKINPDIKLEATSIVNTTPSLIFYNGETKTINLPLWVQVAPDQKNFFYDVAGGEDSGKTAFGLFFNGFYLSHEMAHAFQHSVEGTLPQSSYDNEYFANTVAILWWRKQKRNTELKMCYEYAKKMWLQMPNPVPNGMSTREFFTKNFASQNPYSYGFMQFYQFIQIYEDNTLPDFDTFIKLSLNN